MMTIERASELVLALQNNEQSPMAAIDLFCFFSDHFDLREKYEQAAFAAMCGFLIATNVIYLNNKGD